MFQGPKEATTKFNELFEEIKSEETLKKETGNNIRGLETSTLNATHQIEDMLQFIHEWEHPQVRINRLEKRIGQQGTQQTADKAEGAIDKQREGETT